MRAEKTFVYRGGKFPEPDIKPVRYEPKFLQMELDLESELFFELRLANNMVPNRINQSSGKELREIAAFFECNRNTFFFLFNGEKLAGSVLFLENRVQSLCVSKHQQRQGLGTKLLQFAVNRILDGGYAAIELKTLPGNRPAERFYIKFGFKELDGA
jgi:ribosomal protein S18 acetylase RimI-like enzyme